jgi:hypothetical protein
VIEQKIQTQEYWQGYTVSEQDMEEVGMMFLEAERPLSSRELGRALVDRYCQREQNLVQRQLAQGVVYRPNGKFAVGETLVFPHMGFALGQVVDLRSGHNPEHGEFSVIVVEFQGNGSKAGAGAVRSFAAELQGPHKLSFSDEMSWESEFSVSPDDLYASFGGLVEEQLEDRLGSEPGFWSFRGKWLPSSVGVKVHVGLLNIAEAMIDIQGQPLTAEAIMVELDLPQEVPIPVKEFSLNRALAADERFDDVGDASQVRWSLQRWEPPIVSSLLPRFVSSPVAYDRTGLDVTHLQLEREIDDETSRLIAPPTAAGADSVTILLGYPHWRAGTLPFTERTRFFYPEGSPEQHTLVTFVDQKTPSRTFPGWVLRESGQVCGLEEWYEVNKVLPGAYLKLSKVNESGHVGIELAGRRMQREWVRVAHDAGGKLGFKMEKRPIAYQYDELYVFDESERSEIDGLVQTELEVERPLDELVRSVFLSLVELGQNGMVHSKTLYGAVNILRRCSPGLVFSVLFRLPEFVTAGDGYWIYQGSADVL